MNATMYHALRELDGIKQGEPSLDLHAFWDRTHGYVCKLSGGSSIGYATLLALEDRGLIRVWGGYEPGRRIDVHFAYFQINDAGRQALRKARKAMEKGLQ